MTQDTAGRRTAHLTLTIIIPTFNRRDRLRRLLLGLDEARNLSPEFDVVITVDGSSDGTIEMLAKLNPSFPLHILTQTNRGPAAARNRAMSAAHGDVLLFLDDDVTAETGLLGRHLAVHRHDPYAVVIGPMHSPPQPRLAPWLQWEAVMLQKQYDAMLAGQYPPTPRQFYTANASIGREHALAAGGFDESFTRAEDVEFAYRLGDRGLRFYFDPFAGVLHEPDRSFRSWLRVGYDYGRHDVYMAQRRGRDRVLQTAYRELHNRHPLSQRLARAGVGHPWRVRTTVEALRLFIAAGGRSGSRAQMALCSALFNLQYWQGIADATGLGARVWDGASDAKAVVHHQPGTSG